MLVTMNVVYGMPLLRVLLYVMPRLRAGAFSNFYLNFQTFCCF